MVKVLAVAYEPRDYGELFAGVSSHLGDAEIVFLAVYKAAENVGEAAGYTGKVYYSGTSRPEEIASLIVEVFNKEKPDVIVGEAYKNLRDAFSRVAGRLSLHLVTDATSLSLEGDKLVFTRGFLSEKAVMKASVPSPALVLYMTRFTKPAEPPTRAQPDQVPLESKTESKVRLLDVKEKQVGGVNLEDAEIIVGVGRGFKSKEDLQMAFELAELLGGQVGCTRPIAADLKWLSEDHWIGISGKRVSPKLYLAIGISGSPQHMSGVQGAKVIVAVNKDKSAPIFKQADYGVVADLYQFIPLFTKKLKELSSKP